MFSREVRLERLTRVKVQEMANRRATILVPIGATEQHGPHLPLDTDTFFAYKIALEAAQAFDDVLVAPAIPWGLSSAHSGLGATISLQPFTALQLLLDICYSLLDCGFTRQIWINGHNSNKMILSLLVYECQRQRGAQIAAVTYFDLARSSFSEVRRSSLGGAGHACEFETSLMSYLRPELTEDPGETHKMMVPLTSYDVQDLTTAGPAVVGYSFPDRFPEGVAGDPRLADRETGRRIYESVLSALVDFIGEYKMLSL